MENCRGHVCLVDNRFIYVCTKQTTEPDRLWFNGKVGEFGVAPERVHILTDEEFTNLNLYNHPFRGPEESETDLEASIVDVLAELPYKAFNNVPTLTATAKQIIALVRTPYENIQDEEETK
jgi:hypothetical protein